jgi:Domain of unknown function (DUF5916)/Carbohydrate family 9 binding domain-like
MAVWFPSMRTTTGRLTGLAVGLCLLAATDVHAGQEATVRPDAPRAPFEISPVRSTSAPDIDGLLDDPVWTGAVRITRFVQAQPVEGAPATERTEVAIAYDSDRIYVAIDAHYADVGLMRANRVDRDQIWRDDTVRVYFDPFLDQQRAYVFAVNAYGVQGDALLSGGGGGFGGGGGGGGRGGGGGFSGAPGDASWNALFESAGRPTPDGWTAEMAIPFKSLRYPAGDADGVRRWGFQVERTIQGRNENVVWAPVSRDVPGMLRQMGRLDGLTGLSTSRNLELQPAVTAAQSRRLDETSGQYVGDVSRRVGMNVKYGLTSNLTVDFTVNPDFSQVESDRPQIAVNQRYPLFYSEQRPFFLEGQEAFGVSAPVTAIHTRTIVDPGYGLKVSGKIGRTLVGVLVASDRAAGRFDDPQTPGFGQAAQVVLGRARRDIYENSFVGVVFTDREFLATYSRLAGVDAAFQLGRNHRLTAVALTSRRRDADDLAHAGGVYEVRLDKQGRNLRYGLTHSVVDPDFGTELGFIRRTDTRRTQTEISYRWWPQHWMTNWGPRLQVERITDRAGVLQNRSVQGGVNAQLASNISINADYEQGQERYADRLFDTTRLSLRANVDTSRRVSLSVNVNRGQSIRFVDDPFVGRSTGANVSVTLRLFSRLQSNVNLSTSRFVDPRTGTTEFDVRIIRARTTYQFTDRLVVRNVSEYNTDSRTLGVNLLATYRVNAGTVFYLGYDDRYQEGAAIDPVLFPTGALRRTNRAVFMKLQVLLRY